MSHYANTVMLLCVYIGKHAWCMYVYMQVYVCIVIHRLEGKYIFMQENMHEYFCLGKHTLIYICMHECMFNVCMQYICI